MRFDAEFSPENVDRLREKVVEGLEGVGVTGDLGFPLQSMVDELVCNILEHGQASWVEMDLRSGDGELSVTLRDDGPAFDPVPVLVQERGDRRIDAHVAEAGGRNMGLYMVSKIAKGWSYRRVDGRVNELRVTVGLGNQKEAASWAES